MECAPNYILHHGLCEPDCPGGYFRQNVEHLGNRSTETLTNFTCATCHYTCRTCGGPSDYDCLTCFPDAILTKQNQNENYCYSYSISWVLQAQSMYDVFFLILFILITLLFIGILWILWKLKKSGRYYENLKNNHLGFLDKEQM